MDNNNIQASLLKVIADLFKKTKITKEQKLKLKGRRYNYIYRMGGG